MIIKLKIEQLAKLLTEAYLAGYNNAARALQLSDIRLREKYVEIEKKFINRFKKIK